MVSDGLAPCDCVYVRDLKVWTEACYTSVNIVCSMSSV